MYAWLSLPFHFLPRTKWPWLRLQRRHFCNLLFECWFAVLWLLLILNCWFWIADFELLLLDVCMAFIAIPFPAQHYSDLEWDSTDTILNVPFHFLVLFCFLCSSWLHAWACPCACACTKCVRKRMGMRVCVAVCCERTKMMEHSLLFFLLACFLLALSSCPHLSHFPICLAMAIARSMWAAFRLRNSVTIMNFVLNSWGTRRQESSRQRKEKWKDPVRFVAQFLFCSSLHPPSQPFPHLSCNGDCAQHVSSFSFARPLLYFCCCCTSNSQTMHACARTCVLCVCVRACCVVCVACCCWCWCFCWCCCWGEGSGAWLPALPAHSMFASDSQDSCGECEQIIWWWTVSCTQSDGAMEQSDGTIWWKMWTACSVFAFG